MARPDPDPASLPPKTGAGVIHHTGLAEGDPFAFIFPKGEGEVNGEAEKEELLVPANPANPPVLATPLNDEEGDGAGAAKPAAWVGGDSGSGLEGGAGSGSGFDSLIGAGGETSRSSCLFTIVCRLVYLCPSRMFSSERRIDSRQFLRDLAKAKAIQTPGKIVTKAIVGSRSGYIQINSVRFTHLISLRTLTSFPWSFRKIGVVVICSRFSLERHRFSIVVCLEHDVQRSGKHYHILLAVLRFHPK